MNAFQHDFQTQLRKYRWQRRIAIVLLIVLAPLLIAALVYLASLFFTTNSLGSSSNSDDNPLLLFLDLFAMMADLLILFATLLFTALVAVLVAFLAGANAVLFGVMRQKPKILLQLVHIPSVSENLEFLIRTEMHRQAGDGRFTREIILQVLKAAVKDKTAAQQLLDEYRERFGVSLFHDMACIFTRPREAAQYKQLFEPHGISTVY